MRSWPTIGRTPTSDWWIGCWPRRDTASGWLSIGSTWPATPIRTAISQMCIAQPGRGATGSLRRSTRICRLISLSPGNWPATCYPMLSQEQILATAFNRHHRQTNEGGSVEEEFRVEYVSDRTNTFATAMLGLTLECARCHDHKFDPVTQKEYYQLSAFFNSIDECGLYSHFTDAVPTPTLVLMDDDQRGQIAALQQQIQQAEQRLSALGQQRRAAFEAWLAQGPHSPEIPGLIGDYSLDSAVDNKVANRADAEKPGTVTESPETIEGKVGNALKLSGENNVSVPTGGDFSRNDPFSIAIWINTPDEKDRAVVFHRSRAWTDAGSRGYQLLIEEGQLSASLIHFWPGNALRIRTREKLRVGEWVHVVMAYDGSSRADGLAIYVDGRRAACDTVRDNLCKDITGGGATTLDVGQRFRDRGFKNGLVDELKVFRRCLTPIEVAQVFDGNSLGQLLSTAPDQLSGDRRDQVLAYYLENYDPVCNEQRRQVRQLRDDRSKAIDPLQEIMVMRELPEPRPTFVLRRGAYDARGDRVEAGTPRCLPPWPQNQPKNRLGLARWVTDPSHPLLARVTVNRLWQSLFGRGLVVTAEDLGRQGELPTHPDLLDYLAWHFVDSGWDVKSLVKLLVMSATYRQDSTCSGELRSQDPDNKLLARGPRYRLPAEMIRDNALFVSGLLAERIGGSPVKPFQPEGLWEEKSGLAYKRDEGEGSHRRSLYTFWKRTSPPPSMMILDAAKRDVCIARRQTTASPLQALLLWNDPQYVEAARALAERVLKQDEASQAATLEILFRWLTSRRPHADELAVLASFHDEQRAYFRGAPENAEKLLSMGDQPRDPGVDPIELAALSAVAEMLLSYDETIMKY